MPRILIALLLTLAALVLPSAASAATPLVEGESSAVTKSSDTEWRIVYPSGASGGAALKVISRGTLTANVSVPADTTLVLRDRTDNAARAAVTVDGAARSPSTALTTSYKERSYGALLTGAHTVKIQVSNLGASNYFLDYIGQSGSAPPPPPPPDDDADDDGVPDTADLCPGTPAGTPVDGSGCPIVTPPADEVQATEYTTFYSQGDNDPPGSRDIAYPANDGYPTVHNQAGGTGTYADPISFASSPTFRNTYGIGVRIYVPDLDKYFVLEDSCASCTGNWIDLFIDSDGYSNPQAIARQEDLTRDYQVLVRPGSGYFVNTTPLIVYP